MAESLSRPQHPLVVRFKPQAMCILNITRFNLNLKCHATVFCKFGTDFIDYFQFNG